MSGIRNRRTRTRNYNPLGGPSSQTMQNPDYQSDDDATGPDSWSNPDMEPVPISPLATAAPPNQVGPAAGAGPAAEESQPMGPSRTGSAHRVSPQGTTAVKE